ncbi:pirin family protein [Bradyrhizobium sp. CCBAU 51765]|uniref:pirin family protein n=1 Tax=Bradyrhizobium sp. CCBAU 51765 TaxID=1325102 RepID=UPI0018890F9D|nr:pirin family protein [Bradyrhizobium sp. CCBAU 51765]QOZ10331.1 pimeloyl-CoA dehydrogenase [Bradyrhizobium sp. CCBAU 51765]
MPPLKIQHGSKRGDWNGGFAVEILYPGLALNAGDSGIGAIGRIDRARVSSGHVIAMHPHRDDEILTYVRTGAMLHRDSMRNEQSITKTRLMMMNAGHTFQHEEEMLGPGATEALQIFLRPRAPDLTPKVQFHDFGEALSRDAWRLLAAPEGAPLEVRAQAWVQDARLSTGTNLALPALQASGAIRLVYVFAGEVRIGGVVLHAGESAYLEDGRGTVSAQSEADVVLFTTDPGATVFKGGMFSGNVFSE